MAITLTTTNKAAKRVKCLVYSRAGIGKTTLCATAPEPIIISAESGLMSLQKYKIPVIEINSLEDAEDALRFVQESKEAKRFETICVDSISDIAEVLLAALKKDHADPRKAYGEMNDMCADLIRSFRDTKGKHVYMTAKLQRSEDEDGMEKFFPSMPGKTLTLNLPYWFDIVMALRIGETDEGKQYRYLQTHPDFNYDAKDRSGKLSLKEEPNLAKLFEKVIGKKEK